jgi:hypothetical protein
VEPDPNLRISPSPFLESFVATVAQLVEQGFRKPQVSGSSPLGGFFISVFASTCTKGKVKRKLVSTTYVKNLQLQDHFILTQARFKIYAPGKSLEWFIVRTCIDNSYLITLRMLKEMLQQRRC